MGGCAAGADVGEELGRALGEGGLRERATDVDAGVVIGATDRGSAVGLNVDKGR